MAMNAHDESKKDWKREGCHLFDDLKPGDDGFLKCAGPGIFWTSVYSGTGDVDIELSVD